MDALILIAGLVVLIMGAYLIVEGATSVAARTSVSSLVIGLTVVSIGTSLPEMCVAMLS